MNQNNNLPQARKPIQISKAPEPITPLSGRHSYRPPAKAIKQPIDWKHWIHMPLKPWEAVALSLNINPENMTHHPQSWMGSGVHFTNDSFPIREAETEFTKRLELLKRNLYDRTYFLGHDGLVTMQAFAAWCAHIGYINLPPELVAAKPPPVAAPAQTPATPAPVETVGASDGVGPDKAGPVEDGLLTKEIAVTFDGVNGWSADRWPKNLSGSHWLHPARKARGTAGGASAVWDPLVLAQLIHGETNGDKAKEQVMKAFHSRFNRNPVLIPWRDAFNEYFATHCTSD
jgi:hypothetical protein